jgi:oxygen-independent coproporphyrinogen-3 oxidase
MCEIDSLQHNKPLQEPLKTLFIGGGTPTCISSTYLTSIIDHCRNIFGFRAGAEISVEANPGTVDQGYCESLLMAGVNRLSIGVQSFCDDELKKLGRLHTSLEAERAILATKRAGLTNINIDLMYGLPGQTPKSWALSLEKALSLTPQHLSLYQLMVEEGTPFQIMDGKKEIQLPVEDEILEMDEMTRELTEKSGFIQYETSNYAIQGYQCLHNINYWENRDYLAAGAAAVSFIKGVREKRVADPKHYIKLISTGKTVVVEEEQLTLEESFRETVIMGLRLKGGVSTENLLTRYGLTPEKHYGSILSRLLQLGMVEQTPTHLKITDKGEPLSNQIMAELV